MGWYRQFINMLRPDRLWLHSARDGVPHGRAHGWAHRQRHERDRRAARSTPALRQSEHQQERTRDTDILTWLESLGADVRYALRALRASPGFAIVAILSLGLGIGANTAIFSSINAVVLRPLPVERPEELMQVTMGGKERERSSPIRSGKRFGTDRTHSPACSAIPDGVQPDGRRRDPTGERHVGQRDYFSTLGVRPALGRLLVRADDGAMPAGCRAGLRVLAKRVRRVACRRRQDDLTGSRTPYDCRRRRSVVLWRERGRIGTGLRTVMPAGGTRLEDQLVPSRRGPTKAWRGTATGCDATRGDRAGGVRGHRPAALGRRREGAVPDERAECGRGGERAIADSPAISARVDGAHGGRRPRSLRGVRERRKPAVGSRGRTRARDRRSGWR